MRKHRLLYDVLLFSSVLGVALTSQIQSSQHSSNNTVFSFLKGVTAKAATTSNSDASISSDITKYSDMNNAVSLKGKPAQSDLDRFTTNTNAVIQSLENNANKVKAPADTQAVTNDFKELQSDYAISLQKVASTFGHEIDSEGLSDGTVGVVQVLYRVPTPTDIAALYYDNLSMTAIADAQIKDSTLTTDQQTAATNQVDALFKDKYPTLASFGENFIGKNGNPNDFAKVIQPKDIKAPENISPSPNAKKDQVSLDGRMLNGFRAGTGIADMAKSAVIATKGPSSEIEKASGKGGEIDTLLAFYNSVMTDPKTTNNVAGAIISSSRLALNAISISATNDDAIPVTDTERLAAIKNVNGMANAHLNDELSRLNLNVKNPTDAQQQTIDSVKKQVQSAFASSIKEVNDATTLQQLAKAATDLQNDAYNAIHSAGYTSITDADRTAYENAVKAAGAAQIQLLQADSKATKSQIDSEVDLVNNQVENTVNALKAEKYKEFAQRDVDSAESMIKSFVIIHSDGTKTDTTNTTGSGTNSTNTNGSGANTNGSGTSQTGTMPTDGKTTTDTNKKPTDPDVVTAAQKTNAINALITAGNQQKVAVQNNSSLTDAQKTAAYAAIDKLVSDNQASLNAATNQESFLGAEITGLTAVNNYKPSDTTDKPAATTTPAAAPAATPAAITPATSSKPVKVVYATAKLGMYGDVDLTQHTVTYAKHARTSRPEFTVLQQTTNSKGTKVYYVKNNASGRKGYISASSKYTTYAYYQGGAAKIKVISKHGVNAYRKSNLTSKKYHYKKGAALKVKKLVKSGLTSRYELSNGTYVSANKIFVLTIA